MQRVEKGAQFCRLALSIQGVLFIIHWGEFNPELEIVTEGFDAAQVRRDNLVAYLLPRLGRAKVFVVAEAVGYQGGRFTGIAITCEELLLDEAQNHSCGGISRLFSWNVLVHLLALC